MPTTQHKGFNDGAAQGVISEAGDGSVIAPAGVPSFEGSGHLLVTKPGQAGQYFQSRIVLLINPGASPSGPLLTARVWILPSSPDGGTNFRAYLIWRDSATFSEHYSAPIPLDPAGYVLVDPAWVAAAIPDGNAGVGDVILKIEHDSLPSSGTVSYRLDDVRQGTSESAGDVTAPTIANFAIPPASVGHNSVLATWDTNEPADTQVEYGVPVTAGGGTGIKRPYVATINAKKHLTVDGATILQMKGANCDAGAYGYLGNGWSESNSLYNAVIPSMKSRGMNVFLFGFSAMGVTRSAHTAGYGATITKAEYLRFLDHLVKLCRDNQMYCIFACRNHGVDSELDANGNQYYSASGEAVGQPGRPDAEMEQALALIAGRYKEESHVMYATQVEPHDHAWGSLRPQWERMHDAVHAATAPHKPVVMHSGPAWGRDLSGWQGDPVNRENAVGKFHVYGNVPAHHTPFLNWGGAPGFIGEFGDGDAGAMYALAQTYKVGYAGWQYWHQGHPEMLTGYPGMGLTAWGQSIVGDIAANPPSAVQLGGGTTINWVGSPIADAPVATAGKTTGHTVTIGGLQPSTSYRARARSRDAAGNLATGPELAFVTKAEPASTGDTTPPILSNIAVPNGTITQNGVVVTWQTDELASSQIEYGLTAAYGQQTPVLDTAPRVLAHSVPLGNLLPSTTYHYRVRSLDAAGNLAISTDRAFTTAPAADTTAPAISGVQVAALTPTGATITWGTNEAATTALEYGLTTGYGTTVPQPPDATRRTAHSVTLAGLLPDTTYHARARRGRGGERGVVGRHRVHHPGGRGWAGADRD